jgi:hypothetical protein
LYAGVGLLLLDTVNTGDLNDETLMISASLITAGLMAKFMISNKIKIRGKRKLYVLD